MLPTVWKGHAPSAERPAPVFGQYLRRIIKWQQMDIEYSFWQMLHLCTSPKVVYQHTKYHKPFIMLYVLQYFISPLLVVHGFFPMLVSNLLFMAAISYYHYLNFLGYDVLPFLDKTTFFLYPIGLVIILSPLMILIGFNPTRYIMSLYFS